MLEYLPFYTPIVTTVCTIEVLLNALSSITTREFKSLFLNIMYGLVKFVTTADVVFQLFRNDTYACTVPVRYILTEYFKKKTQRILVAWVYLNATHLRINQITKLIR